MKPALHRSLTFWFGLLVMGFICWAWRDSTRWCSQGSVGPLGFWHYGRAIVFSRVPARVDFWARLPFSYYDEGLPVPYFPEPAYLRGGDGFNKPGWDLGKRLAESEPFDFWSKRRFEMEAAPSADWKLVIPHWLILLAVAVTWLGLLFWRARRRKRAYLASHSQAAEPSA